MKKVKLIYWVLAVIVTFLIFIGVISGYSTMTDWFNGLSPKMQKISIALAPLVTGLVVTLGAIFRFRKRKGEVV